MLSFARVGALLSRAKVAPLAVQATRSYASGNTNIEKLRNIGISAHIDSGKTTLTERILYYTGRIEDIHEVRGKDGVGAKMDSMDLEREKGITIQSAATHTQWKDCKVNIIDTPGHVDFTVEVERALRVLDGAVLVLCSVGGVQSQTLTVDRQMRRYDVPCIGFINKLDRPGGDPNRIVEQMRTKLRRNAVLVQVPIGVEAGLCGTVDLISMKAIYSEGEKGETLIIKDEIPSDILETVKEKRTELIAAVSDFNDEIAEYFVLEEEPPTDMLKAAVRALTLDHKITPVFVGSALKNNGVQLMLDGVVDYLPNPCEVKNVALDVVKSEEKVVLDSLDPKKPFVGLAFKLEEGKYGQLTYMRIYQGTLTKGDFIRNINGDPRKKIKVPRLVRMHSNELEDVSEVGPGEICAIFGLDCSSGDTFTDGEMQVTMTSMFVPDPVLSLSITAKKTSEMDKLGKALARFKKEDPTFRVHIDELSDETIISGMGELHLEIYVERIRREYNCDVVTQKPKVSFKETVTTDSSFDYLHKKQSGGSGQFARVIGDLEPCSGWDVPNTFSNETIGLNIGPEFVPAIQKGFLEACQKGPLTGNPIVGAKFILRDGATHIVDSNEQAFRTAAKNAVKQAYDACKPIVLEPLMKVETSVPEEFQGATIGQLTKRKGMINDTETQDSYCIIHAEVPLNNMFGFSNELRSATQGKGEFTMEFSRMDRASMETQKELIKQYQDELAARHA